MTFSHFIPYAEYGQRKRDYPAHFSNVNPWVKKNFKEFNDYIGVLSAIMSESKEMVSVGILHPIRSAYFDYKRILPYEDNYGVKGLSDAFAALFNKFTETHIPHHFIDETLLAKYGKVIGNKLILGNCDYSYIVIPKIYTMDKTTDLLLKEYVANGGKILLWDDKPEYLEYEEHNYDYLESNITFEEIVNSMPYSIVGGEQIRTSLMIDREGKPFIYMVNAGDKTTIDITMYGAASFSAYDIFSDSYRQVGTKIRVDKGESFILYPNDSPAPKERNLSELMLETRFDVVGEVKNYLTLDFASYSTDGKNFRGPLHVMCIQNELLDKRYTGKVYLRYEFIVDEIPNGNCRLLAETVNVNKITVNGKKAELCGETEEELKLGVYEFELLKKGKNVVEIELDFYEKAAVYRALYGDIGGESLTNSLEYDTTIEAIYLCGCFGVFGDFDEDYTVGAANADNQRDFAIGTVVGRNFKIGKQRRIVTDLIRDGYPFLAGDITLRQRINLDKINYEFYTDKPFQIIEIKVNGSSAGALMLSCRKDISEYLKKGENEIELTITLGNRNLLGPFHLTEREQFGCGPETFERFGRWHNGKSEGFTEDYAFVKTII